VTPFGRRPALRPIEDGDGGKGAGLGDGEEFGLRDDGLPTTEQSFPLPGLTVLATCAAQGHAFQESPMMDNQFDALVDDATHAVNNLFPDRWLSMLGGTSRSNLLVRINDALTPILRDTFDSFVLAGDNRTRACTIAAMICELLETHIAKCDEDGDSSDDRPSHVISQAHGTRANIDSIASCDVDTGTQIYLVLDDGAAFRVTVEAVSS
jgi:hypothetical protein